MPIIDMAIVVFDGMDKVRFVASAKIGDTLHVEYKVVDNQDKDEKTNIIGLSV